MIPVQHADTKAQQQHKKPKIKATNLCKTYTPTSVVIKDLRLENKDKDKNLWSKDKDLTSKDKDKNLCSKVFPQGQ